jgi:hypothetical protein
MIEDAAASTWELKSLAVAEAHRERGLGRRLVEAGLAHARSHDATRVLLSTGAADTSCFASISAAAFGCCGSSATSSRPRQATRRTSPSMASRCATACGST